MMLSRRKVAVGIVALILAAAIGFFALRMFTPPPDDLDLSRERSSEEGLYMVAIAPQSEPIRQGALHDWIVTVRNAAGEAVDDAEISVDGGMPSHGHGLPTEPRISENLGEGRYLMQGVRFNMGGWWVLRLDLDSTLGEDRVEFNIVL